MKVCILIRKFTAHQKMTPNRGTSPLQIISVNMKNRPHKFAMLFSTLAVMSVPFQCFFFQSALSKSQDYEAGMSAFYKGDYNDAKVLFGKAIKENPKDAASHFALGNTLRILRDSQGATKEYQAAVENADSEEMKGNAQAALRKMSDSSEPQSLLMRQLDDRKTHVSTQTEGQQKSILDAAKSQAERIKNDHYVDPNSYRRGNYAEQMKKEGQDQADAVLKRAQTQAADYKKYVDEKNAALNDVSNNLDDQMNKAGGTSKIHLKREGTNLNVRNYEFSH
jgi:tetratricopeptide (TPR) repeat protein